MQEEDARFVAAKAGEVDIALTSATLAGTEIDGMRVVSVDSVDNRGITFPVLPEEGKTTEDGYKIGNNVTSDLAVRKAMSYGIDRDRIISEALNGFAHPAYSECDGLPWWNEEDVIETDVDYAVQLLEEAGWKDSDGDGVREKDGLKAAFNLMYFAGIPCGRRWPCRWRTRQGKTWESPSRWRESAPTIRWHGCFPSR